MAGGTVGGTGGGTVGGTGAGTDAATTGPTPGTDADGTDADGTGADGTGGGVAVGCSATAGGLGGFHPGRMCASYVACDTTMARRSSRTAPTSSSISSSISCLIMSASLSMRCIISSMHAETSVTMVSSEPRSGPRWSELK